MTWVSERSGMASRRMCRTHHTAPRSAAAVSSRTRTRFLALNSMIRSTIVLVLVSRAARGCATRRRLERPQRGPETRLRVDQEVRGHHHILAGAEPGQHLVEALRVAPELYGTRLELTLAAHHEDDPMCARVEHGVLGNGEAVAERHLDRRIDEALGAEIGLRRGHERAHACRPRSRIEERVDGGDARREPATRERGSRDGHRLPRTD